MATATASDPGLSIRISSFLRSVAIAMLAAGVAGAIAGGLGSRVVMRLAAIAAPEAAGTLTENGNVVGEITLAGSFGLMVFAGLAATFVAGGTYLVVRTWLPQRAVVRGLALGAVLLAVSGTLVIDPANADFVALGDRSLNVGMFAGLFVAMGLLLVGAERLLSRWIPEPTIEEPRVGLSVAEAVVAAFGGLAVAVSILAPIGASAPEEISLIAMRGVAGAVLLALGLGRAAARARGWTAAIGALTVAGYVALGLVVVGGAIEMRDAVVTIV